MVKTPTQFRLSEDDLERLDTILDHATEIAEEQGMGKVTRATVIRALIFMGVDAEKNDFNSSN